MPTKKPKTLAAKQATKKIQRAAAKKVAATQARKAAKQVTPSAEPKTRVAKKTAERALAEKAGVVKPKKTLAPKGKKVDTVKQAAPVRAPRQRKGSLPDGVEFVPGSDMEYAFHAILKGGPSHKAVARSLVEHWKDSPTRNGGQKPVSTIMNHVVRRALKSGFHIEETWRVVPDDGVELPQAVQDYLSSLNIQKLASGIKVASDLKGTVAKKAAHKSKLAKTGTGVKKGVRKPAGAAKA